MRFLKFFAVVCLLSGCATVSSSRNFISPGSLDDLAAESQQAMIVEPLSHSWARITTWERTNGRWQRVFWPMRAMVGRNGIAPLNEKREGDGRTPSGTYSVLTAFGYAPVFDTKLSYRQATENNFWVDDVNSSQYNQWVIGKPEANSFEEMKRKTTFINTGL